VAVALSCSCSANDACVTISGVISLGVRIEFYSKVGDVGEPSEDYRGALYRDAGFHAVAVPREGELLSVASLRVGPRAGLVPLEFPGPPFLPVRFVEHYPAPVDANGNPPAYWAEEEGFEPGANVVLHTTINRDDVLTRKSLGRFAADDGWRADWPYDSDLYHLWQELKSQLASA
jgi:hypothetical protein